MLRQLVFICALVVLVMMPALSFADDSRNAQLDVLESSNINAWKMLEGIGDSKQPSSSLDFAPIVNDKNADFSYVPADDYVPAESLPPQIPEPTTVILVGIGLIGLGARRKLRR